MHPEAYDFVRQNCRPWRVCEFGSYNVNGSVRDLFTGWDYVGIDVRPGPGVDIVADCTNWGSLAEGLKLPDESPCSLFNVIVSTEALEHVPRWHCLVINAYRLLRPSGRFVCTAAGPKRKPHSNNGEATLGEGEHYANIEPETLRIALKTAGFSRIEVILGRKGEDVYASAWK